MCKHNRYVQLCVKCLKEVDKPILSRHFLCSLHYTFHQGCIEPPNLYLHHSTLYISPRVHRASKFVPTSFYIIHFTKGASSLQICTCIILHYTFHQGCIEPPNLYLHHSTSSRVIGEIRNASSRFNVPLISLTYSDGEDAPTRLAEWPNCNPRICRMMLMDMNCFITASSFHFTVNVPRTSAS